MPIRQRKTMFNQIQKTMEERKEETVYIDFGSGKLWMQVGDGYAVCEGHRVTIPTDKITDFIHTAQVLGLKAGKL